MTYSIGQDIPDSMPSWPNESDEDVLNNADMSQSEVVARKKAVDAAFSQSSPPIHAAAVVDAGSCQLVVTSINKDRKRDSLVAKVHAEHCGTGGFSDFTLCVPLGRIREIASRIMKDHHGVDISSAKMGSFIDDIGDAISSGVSDIASVAKDVVNATGIGEVVKGVSAIANLPGFKQALGVGGMLFPPLGVSLSAVNAAAGLISKASSGNQPAKQQILNVMQQGWNNASPAAVKAATTLSTVYQAKQAMGVPAPVLTRALTNGVQIALMPGATADDRQILDQLSSYFASAAVGPDSPGYMNQMNKGLFNMLRPTDGGQPMPIGPAPAPSGRKSFDSGSTHVVISGWDHQKIQRLKHRMRKAGFLKGVKVEGWFEDHVVNPLTSIYNTGSQLMLAGR